jgi:hypothetical protein
MKSDIYERKVDTQDELLTCILNAAACIKKYGDQLRLTTCALRTPVVKYIAVDGLAGQLL